MVMMTMMTTTTTTMMMITSSRRVRCAMFSVDAGCDVDRREEAATAMQAVARGRAVRRQRERAARALRERESEAVTKISKIFRGMQGRQRVRSCCLGVFQLDWLNLGMPSRLLCVVGLPTTWRATRSTACT
eukprot:2882078-Rhodomonas_salina.1